jgi:alpha-galactosidase
MASVEDLSKAQVFRWQTDSLDVQLSLDENSAPCIDHVQPRGSLPQSCVSPYFTSPQIPINGARLGNEGHSTSKTAKSLIGSVLTARLRYVQHTTTPTKKGSVLEVVSRDEVTGLRVTHTFEAYDNTPVLRSWSTFQNDGTATLDLTQASSLSIGGITKGTQDWLLNYSVWFARNTWFREMQWQDQSLPDLGIDEVGLHSLHQGHRATMMHFTLSNQGSLSTEGHLPMGAVTRKDHKDTWLWQIEHNGSWRWEIGDWEDGLYIAATGPTFVDHAWQSTLKPGQSFSTVKVALCHVNGGLDEAFHWMNVYRRHLLRPSPDYVHLPIIFNDYMNCLMGNPTEEAILALVDPVARSGAEYFVIDAGWYADETDWWEDVGLWEPSTRRFPSGFRALLDKIRERGLKPGLWLEPEVVGKRSPLAEQLPENAFFRYRGSKAEERLRYSLDYSQPVVREHMNSIVDRLIREYNVHYFKFDYNIDVITGTDAIDGLTTGAAHLAHQRAYVAWLNAMLDRHPGLIIENCSSGGQRLDYSLLAVHTVQSTSDQQDPILYAAVSAACPTAVLPEQGASWAYPQREWSNEKNAFTVVNSLMGRVHLSGRLDALNGDQFALVREGMKVYLDIVRTKLRSAHPFWPLGLPKWHNDWLALGLATNDGEALLAVWRRTGSSSCQLPLSGRYAGYQSAKLLYPVGFPIQLSFVDGSLNMEVPQHEPCARLLLLSR